MFLNPQEAVVHTFAVTLSLLVLSISILAYKRRGGRRYLALSVAFVFLALSQVLQFAESYYLNAFILLPLLDVHVSHLLDLAMLVSFGLALMVK
jgi:hypothetical protein